MNKNVESTKNRFFVAQFSIKKRFYYALQLFLQTTNNVQKK